MVRYLVCLLFALRRLSIARSVRDVMRHRFMRVDQDHSNPNAQGNCRHSRVITVVDIQGSERRSVDVRVVVRGPERWPTL